jgi:hypothetical protein
MNGGYAMHSRAGDAGAIRSIALNTIESGPFLASGGSQGRGIDRGRDWAAKD